MVGKCPPKVNVVYPKVNSVYPLVNEIYTGASPFSPSIRNGLYLPIPQ